MNTPSLLPPGFAVDAFEHPVLLGVLVALAVAILLRGLRAPPRAIPWPAMDEIRAAGARRRDPARVAAAVLRLAALAALAGVLAGPFSRGSAPSARVQGLDLMLVVDTSTSMRALDARLAGEWRTRLDLAREVVKRFALHRVADGDRVGLVVFGETAFTQCPLTRDGDLLAAALARIQAGMAGEATALGDALALAVKRISGAGGSGPSAGAGRLVVLLTDGRSNSGSIPTDIAGALARSRGIRVHTVGIGSRREVPIVGSEGQAGRGLRFEHHDLDAETLEQIATATGGRYFEARMPEDLESVYAAIDTLERVPREQPIGPRQHEPSPEPLLALAGALLLGEMASTRVLRRSLP